MTRRDSNTLSDHTDLSESTTTPPSRSTGGTDPTQNSRRNSKLGHIVDSIRHALAHEQEKPSSDSKQDKVAQNPHEEDAKDTISPAIQAHKFFNLNENGMGAESHQESGSWGWPGLGSFPEPAKDQAGTRRLSTTKTGGKGFAALEPKVEAATFEAIDNAAESEPYGWPGLGDIPASRE